MARDPFDHEYPPGEWTADALCDTFRAHPDESLLPTYEDADFWESVERDDLTAPVVAAIREQASAASGEPVPALPASLYLEYTRTGDRTRYQDRANLRTARLSTYALAECFEREGEYLDEILDYAWAICEQTTWVLPAHLGQNDRQHHDGLPGVVPDEERHVALRSAGTAQQLAEIDHVLGDQLPSALRERIRHEVDRRVFAPFEARDDFWWAEPPTNNWNAVCNAGVVIAALHLLDDPARQARIVVQAANSLEHYLADFDSDGCTAEGIGYWNYGFGNYVQLAAHLEARTTGEYSLLSPPIVEEIATYPLKVELSPGRFIPFSDASEESKVDPFAACWLGRRLELPGLAARGRREFEADPSPSEFGDTLRVLQQVGHVPAEQTPPSSPERVHFTGYDWWISRIAPDDPETTVIAAKGGHNDESHNHNDLGSVVVHARGESLLTDLGSPVYDADFFSERRYEYLVARSLGHSVPYINGTEQAAGAEYAGAVIDRTDGTDADSFAVDLTGAYPDAAGLASLSRTFTLDRGPGQLEIEDDAEFEEEDNEFVEVLVSYFPMEVTADGIVVTGENGRATVVADPVPADVAVERLEDAVRGNDVWRARLRYHADDRIGVALTVSPEPR